MDSKIASLGTDLLYKEITNEDSSLSMIQNSDPKSSIWFDPLLWLEFPGLKFLEKVSKCLEMSDQNLIANFISFSFQVFQFRSIPIDPLILFQQRLWLKIVQATLLAPPPMIVGTSIIQILSLPIFPKIQDEELWETMKYLINLCARDDAAFYSNFEGFFYSNLRADQFQFLFSILKEVIISPITFTKFLTHLDSYFHSVPEKYQTDFLNHTWDLFHYFSENYPKIHREVLRENVTDSTLSIFMNLLNSDMKEYYPLMAFLLPFCFKYFLKCSANQLSKISNFLNRITLHSGMNSFNQLAFQSSIQLMVARNLMETQFTPFIFEFIGEVESFFLSKIQDETVSPEMIPKIAVFSLVYDPSEISPFFENSIKKCSEDDFFKILSLLEVGFFTHDGEPIPNLNHLLPKSVTKRLYNIILTGFTSNTDPNKCIKYLSFFRKELNTKLHNFVYHNEELHASFFMKELILALIEDNNLSDLTEQFLKHIKENPYNTSYSLFEMLYIIFQEYTEYSEHIDSFADGEAILSISSSFLDLIQSIIKSKLSVKFEQVQQLIFQIISIFNQFIIWASKLFSSSKIGSFAIILGSIIKIRSFIFTIKVIFGNNSFIQEKFDNVMNCITKWNSDIDFNKHFVPENLDVILDIPFNIDIEFFQINALEFGYNYYITQTKEAQKDYCFKITSAFSSKSNLVSAAMKSNIPQSILFTLKENIVHFYKTSPVNDQWIISTLNFFIGILQNFIKNNKTTTLSNPNIDILNFFTNVARKSLFVPELLQKYGLFLESFFKICSHTKNVSLFFLLFDICEIINMNLTNQKYAAANLQMLSAIKEGFSIFDLDFFAMEENDSTSEFYYHIDLVTFQKNIIEMISQIIVLLERIFVIPFYFTESISNSNNSQSTSMKNEKLILDILGAILNINPEFIFPLFSSKASNAKQETRYLFAKSLYIFLDVSSFFKNLIHFSNDDHSFKYLNFSFDFSMLKQNGALSSPKFNSFNFYQKLYLFYCANHKEKSLLKYIWSEDQINPIAKKYLTSNYFLYNITSKFDALHTIYKFATQNDLMGIIENIWLDPWYKEFSTTPEKDFIDYFFRPFLNNPFLFGVSKPSIISTDPNEPSIADRLQAKLDEKNNPNCQNADKLVIFGKKKDESEFHEVWIKIDMTYIVLTLEQYLSKSSLIPSDLPEVIDLRRSQLTPNFFAECYKFNFLYKTSSGTLIIFWNNVPSSMTPNFKALGQFVALHLNEHPEQNTSLIFDGYSSRENDVEQLYQFFISLTQESPSLQQIFIINFPYDFYLFINDHISKLSNGNQSVNDLSALQANSPDYIFLSKLQFLSSPGSIFRVFPDLKLPEILGNFSSPQCQLKNQYFSARTFENGEAVLFSYSININKPETLLGKTIITQQSVNYSQIDGITIEENGLNIFAYKTYKKPLVFDAGDEMKEAIGIKIAIERDSPPTFIQEIIPTIELALTYIFLLSSSSEPLVKGYSHRLFSRMISNLSGEISDSNWIKRYEEPPIMKEQGELFYDQIVRVIISTIDKSVVEQLIFTVLDEISNKLSDSHFSAFIFPILAYVNASARLESFVRGHIHNSDFLAKVIVPSLSSDDDICAVMAVFFDENPHKDLMESIVGGRASALSKFFDLLTSRFPMIVLTEGQSDVICGLICTLNTIDAEFAFHYFIFFFTAIEYSPEIYPNLLDGLFATLFMLGNQKCNNILLEMNDSPPKYGPKEISYFYYSCKEVIEMEDPSLYQAFVEKISNITSLFGAYYTSLNLVKDPTIIAEPIDISQEIDFKVFEEKSLIFSESSLEKCKIRSEIMKKVISAIEDQSDENRLLFSLSTFALIIPYINLNEIIKIFMLVLPFLLHKSTSIVNETLKILISCVNSSPSFLKNAIKASDFIHKRNDSDELLKEIFNYLKPLYVNFLTTSNSIKFIVRCFESQELDEEQKSLLVLPLLCFNRAPESFSGNISLGRFNEFGIEFIAKTFSLQPSGPHLFQMVKTLQLLYNQVPDIFGPHKESLKKQLESLMQAEPDFQSYLVFQNLYTQLL